MNMTKTKCGSLNDSAYKLKKHSSTADIKNRNVKQKFADNNRTEI